MSRVFGALVDRYEQELVHVHSEPDLRALHARFAGREGEIRRRLAEALREAPPAHKRSIGQAGNTALQRAEELFAARLQALRQAARARDLARTVDVTLPGRGRRLGHLHPLTMVRRELEAIFGELGFVVATGPQVETDFHNFEALAMPKDHPARDMQDTFYLPGDLLLRTHTSPVQVRTMLAQKPPIRIIAPGRVYRRDDDATHSPMFNQIEGLVVDEGVSMADLKGTLLHLIRRFFGPSLGMRLRPSFFPFTEPSAEVDMECPFCHGSGCRTCKGTGFIEIMGCGMVDPEVFRQVGIDSERYTGFAFGGGIDRMAMLRYGVSDLRLFFSGDVRLSRQFL
ncbi:MAG: phenylalanine--tRNA ligase subunit alpha [Myxococcota bacterium]|nr:phenylalanine--tRNA ligase subunit alpha [Myxococcota bacterium]